MRRTWIFSGSLLPQLASGCPVCDSGTGELVRSAIFSAHGMGDLVAVLSQFLVISAGLMIWNRKA